MKISANDETFLMHPTSVKKPFDLPNCYNFHNERRIVAISSFDGRQSEGLSQEEGSFPSRWPAPSTIGQENIRRYQRRTSGW